MSRTLKSAAATKNDSSEVPSQSADSVELTNAHEAQSEWPGQPAKPPSKQQLAILLVQDEGATLDQMIAATGWLPHTTRAALTGLKKKGYALSSNKVDGVRTYRAVAPE